MVPTGKSPPVLRSARRNERNFIANARHIRNLSIVLRLANPALFYARRRHRGPTFVALKKRSGRVAEVPVISIIDDDASVRTATARLLRWMGFSVHAFASAKEFLSSPRLSETSCVIADVEMPGMNGMELQDYLIAHGHSTPVIFITAFPQDRARERAMKAGAVCFLSKPFDEPQLLECVERALIRRPNAADRRGSE